MKPNGMTWWRLPENREWYRYISIWQYSGILLIAVWSVCFYAAWHFMYADSIENRVEGWARLYRMWAITSLAGILVLSAAFLVVGFRRYRNVRPNICISVAHSLGVVPFSAVVLWLGIVFFFQRDSYEPNVGLALFDASWMMGLNMCAFLSAFVVIHWIARVFFSRRDKADV